MTMINFRNVTATLVLGIALAGASPALAAQRIHHPGYSARAQAVRGDIGDGAVSGHRATALRQCNDLAGKYLQYLWGTTSSDEYRACMAAHGESE